VKDRIQRLRPGGTMFGKKVQSLQKKKKGCGEREKKKKKTTDCKSC